MEGEKGGGGMILILILILILKYSPHTPPAEAEFSEVENSSAGVNVFQQV
jgi:hypothetical protein